MSSASKFSILISNYALKKNPRAVSTSHTRKIEFSVVHTVIIEDPSARQWNVREAQAISRPVTWSIEAAAVQRARMDSKELRYKILSLSASDAKRLGISRNTLWYLKRRAQEKKPLRAYSKTSRKIAGVRTGRNLERRSTGA
ncbi:MAG: hypothetical protein NTX81_03955 [Candidatus Bathyarchaeota archaeon]|nr:hypothetical protein [Candidatus Bathyarchaeota archaeon]